ncbi:FtsK/SpoIIIE domain-containing protein [Psittacicella gerlachiana]|uniref:FtsK domain-containing protein n=1 Tax=Psittacicella gerlachiana TaxID=2028574 RepID=A0A3A1YE37_9GAMM|nr:FtsK/SpoIIIE domain-containing protein [Psittacicella gerlachiana]RIY34397.1 hypothetical protein CKF59_05490 [Psittacicella gerlachiana]
MQKKKKDQDTTNNNADFDFFAQLDNLTDFTQVDSVEEVEDTSVDLMNKVTYEAKQNPSFYTQIIPISYNLSREFKQPNKKVAVEAPEENDYFASVLATTMPEPIELETQESFVGTPVSNLSPMYESQLPEAETEFEDAQDYNYAYDDFEVETEENLEEAPLDLSQEQGEATSLEQGRGFAQDRVPEQEDITQEQEFYVTTTSTETIAQLEEKVNPVLHNQEGMIAVAGGVEQWLEAVYQSNNTPEVTTLPLSEKEEVVAQASPAELELEEASSSSSADILEDKAEQDQVTHSAVTQAQSSLEEDELLTQDSEVVLEEEDLTQELELSQEESNEALEELVRKMPAEQQDEFVSYLAGLLKPKAEQEELTDLEAQIAALEKEIAQEQLELEEVNEDDLPSSLTDLDFSDFEKAFPPFAARAPKEAVDEKLEQVKAYLQGVKEDQAYLEKTNNPLASMFALRVAEDSHTFNEEDELDFGTQTLTSLVMQEQERKLAEEKARLEKIREEYPYEVGEVIIPEELEAENTTVEETLQSSELEDNVEGQEREFTPANSQVQAEAAPLPTTDMLDPTEAEQDVEAGMFSDASNEQEERQSSDLRATEGGFITPTSEPTLALDSVAQTLALEQVEDNSQEEPELFEGKTSLDDLLTPIADQELVLPHAAQELSLDLVAHQEESLEDLPSNLSSKASELLEEEGNLEQTAEESLVIAPQEELLLPEVSSQELVLAESREQGLEVSISEVQSQEHEAQVQEPQALAEELMSREVVETPQVEAKTLQASGQELDLPEQQLAYEGLALFGNRHQAPQVTNEKGEIDFSFLEAGDQELKYQDPFTSEERKKTSSIFAGGQKKEQQAQSQLASALTSANQGTFNLTNLMQKARAEQNKVLPSKDLLLPSQIFDDDHKQLNDYVRFLRQSLDKVTSGAQILSRTKIAEAHRYEIKLLPNEDIKRFVKDFNRRFDRRRLKAIYEEETGKLYVDRYVNANVNLIDLFQGQEQNNAIGVGVDKERQVLHVKFAQTNSLIMGLSNEAKANLLTEIMMGLAFTHSPEDIEFLAYCDDSRHQVFKLNDLPHFIHPVLMREQVQELIALVYAELIRRRRLCAQLNAGDYVNYNHFLSLGNQYSTSKLEKIKPLYVFIDSIGHSMIVNCVTLNVPKYTLATLVYLLNQGKRFGINFIIVNSVAEFTVLKRDNICHNQFTLRDTNTRDLKSNEFIFNDDHKQVYTSAIIDEQEMQNLAEFWDQQIHENKVDSNAKGYNLEELVTPEFYRFVVSDELVFSGSVKDKKLAQYLNYDLNGDFYKTLIQDLEEQHTLVKRNDRYFINGNYLAYLKSALAKEFALSEETH